MDLEEKISELTEIVEKLETTEGNKNNSIFLVFGESVNTCIFFSNNKGSGYFHLLISCCMI